MDQDEAMFGAEVKPKKKINLVKYFAITAGAIFGLSHIGMIGMLSKKSQVPTPSIPVGPYTCLLYTSPSPRDLSSARMPSSA